MAEEPRAWKSRTRGSEAEVDGVIRPSTVTGRCCAVGCVHTGAFPKRNSRSTSGSSSLYTTSASEARRCCLHSLSDWSRKTPESNKSVTCLPSWRRCAVPRLPTTPRAPGVRLPGRVPVGGTVCRRASRLARSGARCSTGSTRHTARRHTTLGAQRHQPPTSSGALPQEPRGRRAHGEAHGEQAQAEKFQPHFRQVSGTRQVPWRAPP